VGLIIADPPFGLDLAHWDKEAPSVAALTSWLNGLKLAKWVNPQFTVVFYCSLQMIPSILQAGLQTGCSSNPQQLFFLSDQPSLGGRGRNSFSTHLVQNVLVLFYDKERPGKGGSRQEFGFDLTKVTELASEASTSCLNV
jgi:hypothetical protein